MKALSLVTPKNWQLIDIPEPPAPGPGDAVVRVHQVGVCGTDISGYLGKMPFFSYPRIPGHELGVDFSLTVSCYDADAAGRACGRCDSCRLRREGFAAAGIPDPTRYRPGAGP